MKVLFIGEGRHDIGEPAANPYDPRPAQSIIPTLARRVCPSISHESVALAWREIPRFNPEGKKRGYEAKVPAAVLVAARFNCSGTVLVADRDGDPNRGLTLQAGAARAKGLLSRHPVATGLAFQCVEAWTLAVPDMIAEELGVEVERVRALYPGGVHVEELSERSGKEDHRPKRLLERIVGLKHQQDSTQFRQAVAERTDIAALENACRKGFAPFAAELRVAIPT